MFRTFTYASLAALGFMIPSAAQAQLVVSVGVPVIQHHHHNKYRVQYRVSIWEERTFCDFGEARRYEILKIREGFDVQMVRFGHDWKVRFNVPTWQTYATVYSHREAHDLEHALESRGYLARVTHY